MEEISKINLSEIINDNQKSLILISKIYAFHMYYLETEEIEFEKIIVGEDIFDYINVINFVYSKTPKRTDIIHKVGLLRNFEVYLDPNKKDNKIIFTNENKDIGILEVEL